MTDGARDPEEKYRSPYYVLPVNSPVSIENKCVGREEKADRRVPAFLWGNLCNGRSDICFSSFLFIFFFFFCFLQMTMQFSQH